MKAAEDNNPSKNATMALRTSSADNNPNTAQAAIAKPSCGTWLSMTNVNVSDGSQPPMTFDLSQRESAGSHSLDRLVGAGSCPNPLSRMLLVQSGRLPFPTPGTIFCERAS